ncbi:MAG TPA: hemerythrin domain-containing protein [Acidimicrobiales bacterium]|nr:hemerythrin domain-containing protein [Acidimicrobiales bacterium]
MASEGSSGNGVAGEPPRPDTSDMVAVHGALRDAFAAGGARVRSVAPDDVERRELIADYYENVLWFLHVHHEGEEELIFPKLRQRVSDAGPLIDLLQAQHSDVVELLTDSVTELAAWRGGDAGAQARLAEDLQALSGALEPHLEDEETEALPICAQALTIEEWGALPGHALSGYQGDKVWLIIGLIQEQQTPEERQVMLEHMPPPVVQMWNETGRQAFSDLAATVG